MPLSKKRQRANKKLVIPSVIYKKSEVIPKPSSVIIKGAQDWETLPLKDIKSALPQDILADIIALGEYDRIRQRSITLEERLRRAYKYHVWHNENFIDGVHKDSKCRLVLSKGA